MGTRALENRVKKLKDLEAQIKELQEQADAVKAEIQAEMTQQDVEHLAAGVFLIRWTRVVSNRFDSKAFKAALPELYAQYTRPSESRRFSITAA